MVVALQKFVGANTVKGAKLLPDGIGVNAENLDPMADDFRGIRQATDVHTLSEFGATQQHALYRMGRETASDTQYWLANTDTNFDFARSMLASDPKERTYGTGAVFGYPAYTDTDFLVTPPYPSTVSSRRGYKLGVPAPADGMTASLLVAGTGADETRVYVATFVRANGDESAPSSTVTLVVKGGSTVTLGSLPAVVSLDPGIDRRRIYVSTGGDFQEVIEIASGLTSTTDDGVTRGAVLQTGGSTQKPAWLEPPDDLMGLIELWGGMHGAFDGKSYRTCVPYYPHAWPAEYIRIVPDKIIGTAKWGMNWFLATSGQPRVAMGSSPLAMLDTPIPFRQACVSKRSVKGVGHGVVWASNAGLCYHGQKGTFVMTEHLLTRAQWRALSPDTIIGAVWGQWYFGFYNNGTRRGFMINTVEPRAIIWLPDTVVYAVFEDMVSDALYLLTTSNHILKWDYSTGTLATATFKSKVFRHPEATNPGCARIIATTYPVTFSLWADGTLIVNAQSVADDNPIRLPSGYVAEEFQVQISGTGPVEAVYVAEEIADLP